MKCREEYFEKFETGYRGVMFFKLYSIERVPRLTHLLDLDLYINDII